MGAADTPLTHDVPEPRTYHSQPPTSRRPSPPGHRQRRRRPDRLSQSYLRLLNCPEQSSSQDVNSNHNPSGRFARPTMSRNQRLPEQNWRLRDSAPVTSGSGQNGCGSSSLPAGSASNSRSVYRNEREDQYPVRDFTSSRFESTNSRSGTGAAVPRGTASTYGEHRRMMAGEHRSRYTYRRPDPASDGQTIESTGKSWRRQ